ncbi:hypothetical protein MAR_011946 [Mya arenaria]|uniref:Uncharacterized protein n=1 Tax=Mya arenaria TaxID=6604 RepID=A0ABY7FVQ1_MYAAR|nr:hypothetical protein MAR_011946 [Mya arenaria]
MNMSVITELLITLWFSTQVLVFGADCDKRQFRDMLVCLKDVVYGINGTYNILAGTDTETISIFCRDGSTNRTAACLEKLYTSCGQNDGLFKIGHPKTWRENVNRMDGSTNRTAACLEKLYTSCGQNDGLFKIGHPKTWRENVNRMCNNLSYHAVYSDCIVRQRATVQHCLHMNDGLFHERLFKHTDTTQTFLIKICSYFKGIQICTVNPARDMCHKEAGLLLQHKTRSYT